MAAHDLEYVVEGETRLVDGHYKMPCLAGSNVPGSTVSRINCRKHVTEASGVCHSSPNARVTLVTKYYLTCEV